MRRSEMGHGVPGIGSLFEHIVLATLIGNNILTKLQNNLHLSRARGYDNAATIGGVNGGVQGKINEHNPKKSSFYNASRILNLRNN